MQGLRARVVAEHCRACLPWLAPLTATTVAPNCFLTTTLFSTLCLACHLIPLTGGDAGDRVGVALPDGAAVQRRRLGRQTLVPDPAGRVLVPHEALAQHELAYFEVVVHREQSLVSGLADAPTEAVAAWLLDGAVGCAISLTSHSSAGGASAVAGCDLN